MKALHLLILLFCFSAISQNKQVLYGFSEIPQSTLINPSLKLENKLYFGIPLLSHIHADIGMSGLSAYDLFADNNESFNAKLESVIGALEYNDVFAINQQLELFTAGFAFGNQYNRNKYLTFGMYQETDVLVYYPKDIVDLAYNGNGKDIYRVFDFSHLKLQAELLSVFHVGLAKQVNEKLSYGVRGKVYSSVFNVKSTQNSGTFSTITQSDLPNLRQGDSFYRHVFDLDLEVKSSGIADLIGDEDEEVNANESVSKVGKRFLFGGNLGFGVDFGVSHQLNEQLQLDASVQDLGFIRHTKNVENYKLDKYYEFSGIRPTFLSGMSSEDDSQDYWDKVSEEFDELIKIDTVSSSYITMRPVKFNAALRYRFNAGDEACSCSGNDVSYRNELGAQLFTITRPLRPQMALTGYFYRRINKILRAKATYTIDSYSFSNVGLGMSAHFGGVNFYFLGDNLLRVGSLEKSQSQSLQLGFNYIFDKKQ